MSFSEYLSSLRKQAPILPCYNTVHILKYYDHARQKKLEANSYIAAENWVEAYIQINQFCNLILQTIPQHNAYSKKEFQNEKLKYKRVVEITLTNELPEIKIFLEEIYCNQKEKKELDVDNNNNLSHITSLPTDFYPNLAPSISKPSNLRTIHVPSKIFEDFLKLASVNTLNNVETCGILTGILKDNVFYITTVILPKQKGSQNTVQTECEEELIDVTEKNNLMTLGWIHTHPTQTAFLSSVDMHTQFIYQIMIKESLAIVCSPSKQPDHLIFWMNEQGMKEIGSCPCQGFHPHHTNEGGLFIQV